MTVTIDWVEGDKPLPLHLNMDLTGAEVVVAVRNLDGADAPPIDPLDADPVDGAAGDLDADPSGLAPGAYSIKARVSRGDVLIATFPNGDDVVLLIRPKP